jgi:hypothetical protein
MKRLASLLIALALWGPALAQQPTARLNGTVVDTAGAAIPKVEITVQNSTASFKAVSDENGTFQLDVPPGTYEVRSDKLPGFAATKQDVTVATKKTADITIVPAISEEGVLCILRVTAEPVKKPKRRRHR